jgi:gliding motility-associated-like protein
VGTCADTACATVQLDASGAPVAGITANGPTTICEGSSVTLTATGGDSYAWSNGETSEAITVGNAGTYSVVATNACGEGNASVDIMVTAGPVATVTGPASACPGELIELVADGGTAYLWSTGAVTSMATVSGPGTYTVTVSADCGTDQASITVLQDEAFEPGFTQDVTTGCAPLCVAFEADDLGAVSYIWNFGDGTSGEGIAIEHCFAAGEHTVTLSVAPLDADPRCPASVTLVDPIRSWPLPIARFSTDPRTITTDAPLVHFINESTGASDLLWHFGAFDDSTSTDPTPSLIYPGIGCYTVLLEVNSTHGCFAEATGEVCVEDAFSVWVPNAFTPNNDGINDGFFVLSTVRYPAQFELLIFDRWGALLFTSDSPARVWDGAGTPNGVYIWKLRMRDSDGHVHERIGHVVLER